MGDIGMRLILGQNGHTPFGASPYSLAPDLTVSGSTTSMYGIAAGEYVLTQKITLQVNINNYIASKRERS